MNTNNPILVSRESEFSWARCEGKGSFKNSAILKDWCEAEIKDGAKCLVIDLAECKAMDSTFMGTLAGLAMLLARTSGGKVQIAEPGEKNTNLLEDLGLGSLLEIAPDDVSWREQISDIRAGLQPCISDAATFDQGGNVLEAHKKLCEADSKNNEKFATVLDFLESELESKKQVIKDRSS